MGQINVQKSSSHMHIHHLEPFLGKNMTLLVLLLDWSIVPITYVANCTKRTENIKTRYKKTFLILFPHFIVASKFVCASIIFFCSVLYITVKGY